MPYYLIGLYSNSTNKLLTSKTFSATDLATALSDAAVDAEFTTLGTIPATNTPRSIENSSSSYINVLLLLIQAAYYASINAALSGFNVIAGQFDDTSPTQATENNVAPTRITSYRALHTNLRNNSGTEIGTTTTPLVFNKANTTKTIQKVSVDVATSGDLPAIAAPGGVLVTKISKIWLQNAGATDVLITLKDGSTTIHKVLLKADCANDYYFNGSVGEEEIVLTANTIFNIGLSASFQIYGFIIYRTDV